MNSSVLLSNTSQGIHHCQLLLVGVIAFGHPRRILRQCCTGLVPHGNDPAAGSPTATLLRLLHPLASEHWANLLGKQCYLPVLAPETSILTSSVATTGGVYKWQGHNRYGLMNHAY